MNTILVKVLCCLAGILFACSCKNNEYKPRDGDLLFQVSGTSEFSEAIASATETIDSLQFVHVGILDVNNGDLYVIEANDELGVVSRSFDNFISQAPSINGQPGIVVMRITNRNVAKKQ